MGREESLDSRVFGAVVCDHGVEVGKEKDQVHQVHYLAADVNQGLPLAEEAKVDVMGKRRELSGKIRCFSL